MKRHEPVPMPPWQPRLTPIAAGVRAMFRAADRKHAIRAGRRRGR